MGKTNKIKMAVWKFASCDGCQLRLLNLEDRLLDIAEQVTFARFPQGFRNTVQGRYDISLVEGSISTPRDEQLIQEVRRRSRVVVAMGACATGGGIQALRNFNDAGLWKQMVYPDPSTIDICDESTPLSDHIHVDFELRGCPINPEQLIEVIAAYRQGRKPYLPTHSLCEECKRKGYVCVIVTRRLPCMGPVTQAGCGALCPAMGRGCYGCFGPCETNNIKALQQVWCQRLAITADEFYRAFQGINFWPTSHRRESERS